MNEDLPNLFNITFIGEYVEIGMNLTDTYSTETAEGYQSGTALATLRGYLLEVDDEYYYIGETPDAVEKAIRKEHVLTIDIVDQDKVFDKILEELDTPEDRSKSN